MDSRPDADCPPVPPAAREREGERLRQLLDAYQNFLGHDLPNQLVTVQAYSRLLEEAGGAGPDEEARLLQRRIVGLSRAMGEQARRLSEIGGLVDEPAWGPPLSLREAAGEVVAGVRCRTDATGIEFRLPGPDVRAPLAEALLLRVLSELVANAVAAIGPGRVGRVAIGGDWWPGGGVLRVGDTGVGVPPERLAGLLRPTRAGGMLLVHQAAALWGGGVSVESAAGEGTTVTLTTGGRG